MADQVNYYEVLGVSRAASHTEIRNAYRRLAKERHPDHPGGSAEGFARLQEAYAVLSDPNRRRQHDEAIDLAYAADQLSDLNLDFGQMEDELSARRRDRESGGGPGLGERLRGRFGRKRESARSGRDTTRDTGRGGARGGSRGRYREVREARWYEPQDFDPEPVTWRTAAISFFSAFVAFIVVGQIGRWAVGMDTPPALVSWAATLGPFMPILYLLVGLVGSYFAFRSAGYVAVALVFLAALVVGGRGGPVGLLQFGTLGIMLLLGVIYLGNRRDQAARR